jgi:2-polyprenyl-3-methyl-5-hydroxy-6-metoxy-1,4-benzoquinol methylase
MVDTSVDAGYYENERPEIAQLVPSSANMILDVGCGKGKLGSSLKQQVRGRKVYGIEYLPAMASEAERVLDGVLVGDLHTMSISFPVEFFDCMIFADVLEHVVDPAAILHKLRPHLKKNGIILCSIPNIRHYTAILKVIEGWEYDEYGLFDRTHLRFFTLESMTRLLQEAGFSLEHCEPKIVASKKMLWLNRLLLHQLDDRLAMQYLLRAKLAL